MKKIARFILMAAMAVSLIACGQAETETESVRTAAIGDDVLSFTNEQAYYDITYRYPDEFVLEIQEGETLTRHILHYQAEGYDLETDRLVISRTNEYGTPEERMKAFSLLEEVATTEVNGAVWAIGTKSGESGYSIVTYACAAGGYVYTFSFSTDYPAGFDPAEFARVFAEEVAGCDGL